jgi:lipopolysaccharide transport system ATP-binding protein
MSKPIIEVKGLSKKYRIGERAPYGSLREEIMQSLAAPFKRRSRHSLNDNTIWALKDVSFEVKEGEVLGIIGRNGGGKSTLLKILSRITEPTEGRVGLRGRVASLLEVGTGFHPELTGRENILLNGALLGMTKQEIKRKFDEIVDFSEIEKFLDTPVKRYSSGMYVRLAFAVAAHLDPEILLIDEVLAVGDVHFQKKCLGKMQNVAGQGRTVLFVSHNLLAVKGLCSRGILLEKGRMACIDDASTVIDTYLSRKAENLNGEVSWDTPKKAPGNHQVRLRAVRIVSDGQVTAAPSLDNDIEVQIDYWNLEEKGRRLISIHVINKMGITLFTSANLSSVSKVPDPWVNREYPRGLYRTTCVIPRHLLNDGEHSLYVSIHGRLGRDNILRLQNAVSFDAQESEEMRKEFTGKWLGVVRPRLLWKTEKIE